MSVRNKALCFAILVPGVLTVAGCSISSPAGNNPPIIEDQASLGSELYGDQAGTAPIAEASALPSEGASEAGATLAQAPQEPKVIESRQLLAATDASSGMVMERGSNFTKVTLGVQADTPVVDVMTLNNPSRLVVDIIGQEKLENQDIAVNDAVFFKAVRLGAHHDRTRVVFDINEAQAENFEHIVDASSKTVSITFSSPAASEQNLNAQTANNPELPIAAPSNEQPQVSTNNDGKEVRLDTLKFSKTSQDGGSVLLGMSQQAAFIMRRTAPSEYVLTIPGATSSARAQLPQIAPKGFPGIRSVRAVASGDDTLVRMFVDDTVTLQAFPRGNEIVIEASNQGTVASKPQARGQLAEEEGELEEDDNTARLNPTGIRSADGSKIYTGRLISLDLQDTDIDNALRIIAEVSNLNIIASDDVSGKVTLRLIDVPWDQALDVILKTNGLDQVTEGNVIRIAPVDKLRQEREALREAKRAAQNLEDLTVMYVRISYARASDMIDQVQAVLSERGTVAEDDRTNQLIIKDIKKGHEQAIELIKRLDLRTPQVLLETQIVEGSRNILRDLGFQWNFSYVASPATGNATGLNFPNSVSIGGSADTADTSLVNFPAILSDAAGSAITAVLDSADGSRALTARISALETEGRVRVVSRPQIATVNNKTAEIRSVETVRVRLPDSGTSVATGAGAQATGGGRTAFEEIDVGIELVVTPQASPDYYVLLDLQTRSSTFGSTTVDNIPSTLERQATSTILVKSGQTFALGGVYRIEDTDQIQGVPFFKDIPVIGMFFRRTAFDKSDEELIFFITPHIVEGSFDPSLM